MRFVRLIIRNILRRPARLALTVLAVATSIFIFASLLSLDVGVKRMVQETGDDLVLTVFEKYKACPPYSRLPSHYEQKIEAVPHVSDVMPVRFLLSNCQTTTDLVAVHGIEPSKFRRFQKISIPDEQYQAFAGERGAAIVGRAIARKYRWRVGDQVTLRELRGVSFVIRGIFDAPGSSLESVIFVDREYLEYSIQQVGSVTLFLVKVDSPKQVDDVSYAIDSQFANYETQTRSGPEKEFIASSVEDFQGMVQFAQAVAYVALVLLLAAVANSVSMTMRDRLREIAIMRTLGFRRNQVVGLVLIETLVIAIIAAAIGSGATWALLAGGQYSISVEGYTIAPHLSGKIALLSLAVGAGLGLAAAFLPARRAARMSIITALREVD